MTFPVCFWYLVLCRALAKYLKVLLFMIKACRATDQGAERQLGDRICFRTSRRKLLKGTVIVLTSLAHSETLFSYNATPEFLGFIFVKSPWASLPAMEGEAQGGAAPLLACQHKVLWVTVIYILLKSGPGSEEAISQNDFGFHIGDCSKINKALGSAEAAQHRLPSPPLACDLKQVI